jgi:signal transduction histidine kinase
VVVGDRQWVVEKSPDASEAVANRAMELARQETPLFTTLEGFDEASAERYYYYRLASPASDRTARELDEFDEITIMVGRTTVARDRTLTRLTLLVVLLPLLAWVVSALAGRWVVRRALLPLTRMSQQACDIGGANFTTRLDVGESADELAELGATFNRLLDRQQVAFERQRRFAGDAAHELRTPLTVLLGQIDVALRRPRSEAEYVAGLQLLRGKVIALQEIVESLLFLARSDEEGKLPTGEFLSFSSWLDAWWEEAGQVPRGDDLKFTNLVDPAAMVQAPAPLLARVLDNLLSNALKYSPAGTPVEVLARSTPDEIAVEVADRGSGIAAAEIPSLFDPFYRSPAAREKGIAGSGLGLAIAHRIATSLGGTLTCESEPGVGTRFTLKLPRPPRGA